MTVTMHSGVKTRAACTLYYCPSIRKCRCTVLYSVQCPIHCHEACMCMQIVFMYTYIKYIHKYAAFLFVHDRIYLSMHVHVYTHTHTYVHVLLLPCTGSYHLFMYTYIKIHTCAASFLVQDHSISLCFYTHTYIYAYIHTYIHTYTCCSCTYAAVGDETRPRTCIHTYIHTYAARARMLQSGTRHDHKMLLNIHTYIHTYIRCSCMYAAVGDETRPHDAFEDNAGPIFSCYWMVCMYVCMYVRCTHTHSRKTEGRYSPATG
jgi:hypothetical protein